VDIPAILGSLQVPASATPPAQALANSLAGQSVEATLEAILPDGLLLRLPDGTQLQAQGTLPFPLGSALTLAAVPLPDGTGLRLQVIRAVPPPSTALLSPLVLGEAAGLLSRIQSGALADLLRDLLQAGPATAEQPEAWSAWMKAAMKTLADPAASPNESTFHRLQAQEGTGWFELPLPWAPGAEPVRIWIEDERSAPKGESDPARRVFLSIPFSTLGEVRLGVEQRSAGTRVRLWVQNPQQLAAVRQDLERELASLGRPVDLKVFTLPPGTPDLRAMAGASPLQALG